MRLVEIHIAPDRHSPMQSVAAVRAIPAVGLEGDRYQLATGSFSRWPGPRRELTLIRRESLERMREEFGIDLADGLHRRNLVVEGVDLERSSKVFA